MLELKPSSLEGSVKDGTITAQVLHVELEKTFLYVVLRLRTV